MRKKRLVLAAVMAVAIVGATFNARAEEFVGSHETDVSIGFEASEEPVAPVNPENPGEGSGEEGTGQPGPLSLDWAPTLEFGADHIVTGLQQTYNATTTRPYLQVSDLRGTGTGWKVTAALSPFENEYGESLTSAYITLKNGRTNTATTDIVAPDPVRPVVLESDNAATKVVSASAELKAGRGTWVVRWYPVTAGEDNTDVGLTIPASSVEVGSHTAIILWTLYDAP